MVSIKTHQQQGTDTLLAACDKELLGQTFSENTLKLEVSEDFYGGEIVEIEIFAEKLKNSRIANLVGEKVVNKAIELGLTNSDSIIKIAGIPHAQIVNL